MIAGSLKSSAISGGSLGVGSAGMGNPSPKTAKLEFKNVMAEANKQQGPGKKDLHAELTQLQQRIERGDKIDSRELILYQIKAGQFGLEVELVSKVAEAGLSTARKFQSQQ